MFVSLVAIVFATNRAQEAAHLPNKSSRAPASLVTLEKERILGPFKVAPILRHTQKLHGPLSVRIDLASPTPAEIGEVFVLRGSVFSKEDLQNVEFVWSVPPGLEVINGQLNGTLNLVSAAQARELEVTLRKTTTDNVQVHLMVNGSRNDIGFADSAQYNTEVQTMLYGEKKDLDKSNESAPRRELKVFH